MSASGWAALAEANEQELRSLACFVSPHGFGHATRAAAVMAALRERDPSLRFHIFTQAPEWVFAESLGDGYTYHTAATDLGLVQASALTEDLDTTLARLPDFFPPGPHLVRQWADWVLRLGCEAVLCDIAPLGLAVARAARLPAVLIENFTWDWIYAGYVEHAPEFARHLDDVRAAFALADHRLQTDPLCAPWPGASARLPPIARAPRLGREATRQALGLQAHERLVLVTLGGMAAKLSFPPGIIELEGVVYAIPGGAAGRRREGQRLLLPHHSGLYHPDLIAASDAVIGKTGYSTVAEAYHAGVPFGYVPRPRFPESPVMAAFIEREMGGVEVAADDFEAGRWAQYAAALLRLPRRAEPRPNGAGPAADYIRSLL